MEKIEQILTMPKLTTNFNFIFQNNFGFLKFLLRVGRKEFRFQQDKRIINIQQRFTYNREYVNDWN